MSAPVVQPELRAWFSNILRKYDRVAVAGPPRCGKSTLVHEVWFDNRPVLVSDDFQNIPWAEIPDRIKSACEKAGARWTLEGVMVARTLRRGLLPDAVAWLDAPRVRQSQGQYTMGKAIRTVFNQWRSTIGASVPYFVAPEVGPNLMPIEQVPSNLDPAKLDLSSAPVDIGDGQGLFRFGGT